MSIFDSIRDWRPRPPFYYGWLILIVASLGTYAATGSAQLVIGGIQSLIIEDTGWDRTAIALCVTAGTWTSGLLTPFVGRLTDRYGPRPLMPLAAMIMGFSFFAIAGTNALWQFYVAYIIARAIGNPILVGVVPRTTAVNFFLRNRNLALGITSMARPIGGAINIQVISLISRASSWRTGYRYLGTLSFLLVIPLYLVMRRRPSDIGLLPDGDERPRPAAARSGDGPSVVSGSREFSWRAGEAALSPVFWLIVVAEMLVILTDGTISFQVVPFLRDSGMSLPMAAIALSISSIFGAVVNPGWGYLSDRYSPRLLALIALPTALVSISLFLLLPLEDYGLYLVVLWGTSTGGMNILNSMIIARYFGRAHFGSITGLMGPLQIGALGLGPIFGATLFRTTGSYTIIFMFALAAFGVSFLLIYLARPPRLPRRALAEGLSYD